MTDEKIDYTNYIHCPVCESHYVTVDRNIGDRGGTESLVIKCADCENDTTVIP
jgi:predicted Zn finger-like uncharacterized protein